MEQVTINKTISIYEADELTGNAFLKAYSDFINFIIHDEDEPDNVLLTPDEFTQTAHNRNYMYYENGQVAYEFMEGRRF